MYCYCSVCDEAWIPHFATLMNSVAEFDRSTPFFLFHNGLIDVTRGKISAFADSLGVRLVLIEHTSDELKAMPIKRRQKYTEVVWLKLYFAEALPAEYERAILIDSDAVALEDIRPLFHIDLQGKTLAAVADSKPDDHRPRLQLDKKAQYVNTGLMVVDLAQWRRQRIGERARKAAVQHPERIDLVDQDAINLVAQGEILEIDRKWNYIPSYGKMSRVRKDIAVLHYAGIKPWTSWTPGSSAYHHFRSQTAFPIARPRQLGIIAEYIIAQIKRSVYKAMYCNFNLPVLYKLKRNITKVNRINFDKNIRKRYNE